LLGTDVKNGEHTKHICYHCLYCTDSAEMLQKHICKKILTNDTSRFKYTENILKKDRSADSNMNSTNGECVLLAMLRNDPLPENILWKKVEEGKLTISSSSPEHEVILHRRREMLPEFTSKTIKQLETILEGFNKSKQGNKPRLIDRALNWTLFSEQYQMSSVERLVPTITIDTDQQKVIDACNNKEIIVNAGPGSGKTTTLCAYINHCYTQNPKEKILVLSFNVVAEKTMLKRLRTLFHVPVSHKSKIRENAPGVYVLTFDKYIHNVRLNKTNTISFDYSTSFTEGLKTSIHAYECFDRLIIDEAQDVKPNHATLIKQLTPHCAHVVIAGDPRQEQEIDTTWFSKLWASSSTGVKYVLRYNYRSSPEIVDFLNKYSRQHFPTLHHDQLPVVTKPGTIKYINASSFADEVDATFKFCKEHITSYPYILHPVSVKKYKMNEMSESLRQEFRDYDATIQLKTIGDDVKDVDDTAIILSTVQMVKGSERDAVMLVQADKDYITYGNIPMEKLLKKIYVGISRAKTSLCIVFNAKVRTEGVWSSLVPSTIPRVVATKDYDSIPCCSLSVLDDMVRQPWSCIEPSSNVLDSFDPLNITYQNDPDVVGLFIEKTIAHTLGIDLSKVIIREAKHQGRQLLESLGCFHRDDGFYEYVFNPFVNQPNFKKQLEILAQDINSNPVYVSSIINHSSRIGKIWTVSERLKTEDLNVLSIVECMKSVTGVDAFIYNEPIILNIVAHRSDVLVGMLHGVIDFSNNCNIVEIKHAVPSSLHKYQTSIYAGMKGLDRGYLLNTLKGEIECVKAISKKELYLKTRALFALKHGLAATQKLPKRSREDARPCICIDIEYIPQWGTIYEIAAVVFMLGSSQVIDVFHEVCDGMSTTKESMYDNFGTYDLTGLFVQDIDKVSKSTTVIHKKFTEFYKKYNHIPVVQYSGNDCGILSIEPSEVIDVSNNFKAWLQRSNINQKQYNLKLAVETCLGNVPFVPHRAFEDACLTAAVLTSLTDVSGEL
jgi:hypothetical protein